MEDEKFPFPHNRNRIRENTWVSRVALEVKNPPADAGDMRGRFPPCVGEIPWRRRWQPTPVFLPGEYHGQRSLMGCGSPGHKEPDTSERLSSGIKRERLRRALVGRQI